MRAHLAATGFDLNQSQWAAWEEALTHRLRLIWGPPGTGKSRTVRTIILGALFEAVQQDRSIRVLLAAPTYEAIDNVFLPVASALQAGGPLQLPGLEILRLRSKSRPSDPRIPQSMDLQLTGSGQPGLVNLTRRLNARTGLTLVAGPPQQVFRLMRDGGGSPVQPWFDLIVVDEASQMDAASSTLVLAGLAEHGSVVIAGDPKQLPPIHQAEAPLGLEYVVGPIFTYLKERHALVPMVLEENYRSNRTIVEFALAADYPPTLRAVSPALELDFVVPMPSAAHPPAGWPAGLHWSPDWSALLDPSQPAVCFVYPEGRSSQWNDFEADAVAALVWLLHGSLGDQLRSELDPSTGIVRPLAGRRYTPAEFWARGVGIVTPHRAQQALIVTKLQRLFQGPGASAAEIRGAVDTVERFQGQQRDVMLATFALGDPDEIRDEDEFLMNLNRFNVMASRTRAKLVVFISQEIVNHLPTDMDVLRDSALLKTYAETFCGNARPLSLKYLVNGALKSVPGTLRWR